MYTSVEVWDCATGGVNSHIMKMCANKGYPEPQAFISSWSPSAFHASSPNTLALFLHTMLSPSLHSHSCSPSLYKFCRLSIFNFSRYHSPRLYFLLLLWAPHSHIATALTESLQVCCIQTCHFSRLLHPIFHTWPIGCQYFIWAQRQKRARWL